MRALSAPAVLEIWERHHAGSSAAEALALLAAGCPEKRPEDLAALPLGERDRLLLELRRLTLGSTLESRTRCPQCAEVLEFSLDVDALRQEPPAELPDTLEHARGELTLRFRLPTSADLLAAETCASVDEAGRLLAERCIGAASRAGTDVPVAALTAEEIGFAADEIARIDAQAETLVHLRCAPCGHAWREIFDVASFFHAEIAEVARRLLREVYALARGFGWREADVLAMSARRRRAYLEMLAA